MNLPALAQSESGRVIRIAGTRVTLDTVVGAFERGATPEEIAQDYPAVSLVDVYAVIAYYLRHQDEIRAYLRRREHEHAELRREIEGRAEYRHLRQRLLARIEQASSGSA